jgi:hypothetical protein
MKKRNRLGIIGMSLMALATVAIPASLAKVNTPVEQSQSTQNQKATQPIKEGRKYNTIHSIGGMSMVANGTNYGMSPKDYGERFGHGNKSGHLNMLRVKHNSKLKRRIG